MTRSPPPIFRVGQNHARVERARRSKVDALREINELVTNLADALDFVVQDLLTLGDNFGAQAVGVCHRAQRAESLKARTEAGAEEGWLYLDL